jgi:dUTP pyrophosphatase
VPQSVEILIQAQTVPTYAHPGDAGADLVSTEDATLLPGERRTLGTGVSIALPDGFVAFVVPRSGLAAKHGITIVNSPGTVDAGTDASETYRVAVGDRIAQLIIMPVTRAVFIPVEVLPGSDRGEAGFGSTGYAETHTASRIGATESSAELNGDNA